MKYTDTQIGFQEFPDEISLLINISNCPFHCPGCHSPELWEDIGIELTEEELSKLIESNKGITCVGLMGGTPKEINHILAIIKNKYKDLKTGWYYGGEELPKNIALKVLDYIKIGPYIKERGGLDNPNTNQRFCYILHISNDRHSLKDITYKFWKHGNNK